MSFRDKFSWSPKLNGKWPLEKVVAAGPHANLEMQKAVKSAFDQGIERLSRNQAAASAALQAELSYQSERLGEEITRQIQQSSREMIAAFKQGSASIVDSIQRMSDYLGAELCEVRWAVERHTTVSQQQLQVLLESLDNKSRQYYEQGVKCYEANEYEFAKERFNKALEANRTNYFAYQYLGFVAVTEDKSEEALRNFDLARKFADGGYHQALALSHLARCHYAGGDLSRAVELARAATEAHAQAANFWYESAAYCVGLGLPGAAIRALREAIERDWTYWAVVVSDTNFDAIRPEVNRLLHELREREKEKARQSLERLKRAIKAGIRFGIRDKIDRQMAAVPVLEEKSRHNNVYVYREITPEATKRHDEIFEIAEAELKARLPLAQAQLRECQREWKSELDELKSRYGKSFAREGEDENRWLVKLPLLGVLAVSFIAYSLAFFVLLYLTEVYKYLTQGQAGQFSEAFAFPVFLAVAFGVPAVAVVVTCVAFAVAKHKEKTYQAKKKNLKQEYGGKTAKLKAEAARLEEFIRLSEERQYA